MLGLTAYGSSSEDEAEQPLPQSTKQELKPPQHDALEIQEDKIGQQIPQAQHTAQALDGESNRPIFGPAHKETEGSQSIYGDPPTSRTLIHDLTLPPVPNLDIPPSPPGSPEPARNARFAHFLRLKRQDVHFNEKLAASASLRNPTLLSKMMEHAGIDEQAQYSSSLPTDVWNTSNLPDWGYKEELLKAQKKLNLKGEEQMGKWQRDTIEFIPSDPSSSAHMAHTKPKPR
ncbi:HCNGP-like protein-domain-containing protein [Aspergillus heterothallicus]